MKIQLPWPCPHLLDQNLWGTLLRCTRYQLQEKRLSFAPGRTQEGAFQERWGGGRVPGRIGFSSQPLAHGAQV